MSRELSDEEKRPDWGFWRFMLVAALVVGAFVWFCVYVLVSEVGCRKQCKAQGFDRSEVYVSGECVCLSERDRFKLE